jgi:hypothetical protein
MLSALMTDVVTQLTSRFQCPEELGVPVLTGVTAIKLVHFIESVLERTQLPPTTAVAGLVLLERLKTRFPQARGSSGHRLFFTAIILASKILLESSYSSKSWRLAGQKFFTVQEINMMERELCAYLGWDLFISARDLTTMESRLKTIDDSAMNEGA